MNYLKENFLIYVVPSMIYGSLGMIEHIPLEHILFGMIVNNIAAAIIIYIFDFHDRNKFHQHREDADGIND